MRLEQIKLKLVSGSENRGEQSDPVAQIVDCV